MRMTVTSRAVAVVVLLIALIAPVQGITLRPADASPSAETDFLQRLNRERTSRGLPQLQHVSDLRSVARSHSDVMAARTHLHHNPRLASDVSNWQRLTENVGRGPSVSSIHTALMNSPGHRANILDRRVTQVGIGVTVRNGTVWVTQVFRLPTGASVLSAGQVFRDVPPSSTHGSDIAQLAAAGLTSGCGSGNFCPKAFVTRAEMASFLTRALDLPSGHSNTFRDVSGTHARNIDALAHAGITRGCNPPRNDRYCPNAPVTRAEMATFLVRALDLPASRNRFRDVGGVHADSIGALANSGITRGCNPPSNDRYCPSDPVTREQMATFLIRAFDP